MELSDPSEPRVHSLIPVLLSVGHTCMLRAYSWLTQGSLGVYMVMKMEPRSSAC